MRETFFLRKYKNNGSTKFFLRGLKKKWMWGRGLGVDSSLCYKLHTPSVGLEPATCLSKARIP